MERKMIWVAEVKKWGPTFSATAHVLPASSYEPQPSKITGGITQRGSVNNEVIYYTGTFASREEAVAAVNDRFGDRLLQLLS
jgi:hypothetical protein